jgi:hypothetical protein
MTSQYSDAAIRMRKKFTLDDVRANGFPRAAWRQYYEDLRAYDDETRIQALTDDLMDRAYNDKLGPITEAEDGDSNRTTDDNDLAD